MGQSSSSASASSSSAASSSATGSSPKSQDIKLESYCNKLPGSLRANDKRRDACEKDEQCSYNKTKKICEVKSTGGSKKYTLKKKKHR